MFDRYPAPSLGARRVLRMAFLIEITLEDIVSLSFFLVEQRCYGSTHSHPWSAVLPPGLDAPGDQGSPIDRSIDLPSSPRPSFSAFDRSIFVARVKTWSAKKKKSGLPPSQDEIYSKRRLERIIFISVIYNRFYTLACKCGSSHSPSLFQRIAKLDCSCKQLTRYPNDLSNILETPVLDYFQIHKFPP